MTANEVEQILSWKNRRGQERLGAELHYEISGLRQLWREKSEASIEFADFVPMRLVTIIEVFIREIIRELVDYGQPYIDRAERLTKGSKIDFIFASHVHSRKLSIGDIVAHSVSVNNPTQLISYFVTLMQDFVQRLKISHPRWSEDKDRWPLPSIIFDYDDTIARLARLFQIRHVVTHELPREKMYDVSELGNLIEAGSDFLEATDWVIVHLTRGDLPRTQTEMNIHAGSALEDLTVEMEAVLQRLREKGEVDLDHLAKSQNAWTVFAEEEANLHASPVAGGSLYPTIWAPSKADATRQRIKDLKWWDEREEGDM
jgi:uncharacterized protein YecT (DUF1311 family)